MRELYRWVGILIVLSPAAACNGEGGKTVPLDERLSPGEVRAGVISKESELLGGVEAHGWIGDFKLYNSEAAFVVQNAFEPRGWGPYGGSLLDAGVIREEGEEDREEFEELFLIIDLLSMQPTSAEVLADGSDGQAAVVRVSGKHRGIPLVDAALSGALQRKNLEILNDYILEPDASYLRIRTSIRSRGPSDVTVSVGDLVLNGDPTSDFTRGPGMFGNELPGGEHPYLGGFSRNSCNLYTGPGENVKVLLSLDGITPLEAGKGAAPSVREDREPLVVERLLVVGAGGMDACLRTLNQLRGESGLGLVGGSVTDTSGAPESGALLLARDLSLATEANYVNQTYTNAQGAFELELPAGEYVFVVRAEGRDEFTSDTVSVAADQTTPMDVSLPPPARLAYRCRDESGGALPCKISIQAGHDAAMSARVHMDSLTFGVTGEGEFVVPAGEWTVTLSRGWEYNLHRQNITATAGETTEVTGTLARQVDTTGFVAADVHNHCTRSIDSTFDIQDKIGSNIVEAVEVLVVTDHDCQTDFNPVIEEMEQELGIDLDTHIRAVIGNEVSPLYGHNTAFPLPGDPTGWIYWQIPWTLYQDDEFVRQLQYPEIWVRMRELGAEIINIAHPLSHQGFLDYLGFDPPAVIPRLDSLDPEKFTTDFDTIELLNGDDWDTMLNKVLPVWSSMNNQGVFRTAVGVSDSHQRDAEAGFGRTLVASSSDEPADIDLGEIWTSLKQGRAMVGGGIYVTIGIAGGAAGDLVTATPPFDVHLQVQAADWITAEQVILIANGETVATLALEAPGQIDSTRPALRFDGDVSQSPAADTWYTAVATGPQTETLDPVFRGCRAVGMTNAVRVDVDGNGKFDPPDL